MARTTKAGHPEPAPLPLWRLLAVSAVALTTANCAQNAQKLAAGSGGGSGIDPKYGVKASPRLYNEGDVIPKGGGRRFSGKPYVVAGRTYVPREDAKGYVREGLASWYGAAFHGRMTANGEVFDRQSIAAAHPTLPLPSYARVTNLSNGRSMIVRVNDRGPYHANRLMDVSEEVAEALEFRRSGTARVRVEYAGKASTAGSDDRKLLATLRTDGQPASIRGQSPVMMADLGPDAPQVSSERLARASRPALAFKQAGEDESAGSAEAPETAPASETAPAPRPVRPAPVLVAGAATVAVPAAVQPTALRGEGFRPVRHAPSESHPAVAQAAPRAAPLGLAPPPLRLAGARPDTVRAEAGASRFAALPTTGKASPTSGKTVSMAGKDSPLSGKATPLSGKPVPASHRMASASDRIAPSSEKPALPVRTAGGARPATAGAVAPLHAAAKPAPARLAATKAPPVQVASGKAEPAAKTLAAKTPAATTPAAKASAAKPSSAAKPALLAKAPAHARARFAEAR